MLAHRDRNRDPPPAVPPAGGLRRTSSSDGGAGGGGGGGGGGSLMCLRLIDSAPPPSTTSRAGRRSPRLTQRDPDQHAAAGRDPEAEGPQRQKAGIDRSLPRSPVVQEEGHEESGAQARQQQD